MTKSIEQSGVTRSLSEQIKDEQMNGRNSQHIENLNVFHLDFMIEMDSWNLNNEIQTPAYNIQIPNQMVNTTSEDLIPEEQIL